MVTDLISLRQLAVHENNWGYSPGQSLHVDLTDSITKVEMKGSNPLTLVAYPVSKKSTDSKAPSTIAIPLKRITTSIILTGYLCDTEGGDSSWTKMKKLMAIFEGGGNVILKWRGQSFSTTDIMPVQITNVDFIDEWEIINGTDTDKIDSNIPQTNPMYKIQYIINVTLGRERNT